MLLIFKINGDFKPLLITNLNMLSLRLIGSLITRSGMLPLIAIMHGGLKRKIRRKYLTGLLSNKVQN